LILLSAQLHAAWKMLARIHNDLRIVCTVLQESPEERSTREEEDWEYSGTPNLIRQKRSENGVPFHKED
jgi:hypothetical protein